MDKKTDLGLQTEDIAPLMMDKKNPPIPDYRFPEKTAPGILQTAGPVRITGQMISRLISETQYVSETTLIGDLVHALRRNEHIHALGVTVHDGKIAGVIDLKEMFALLGKPYCQEVYYRQTVKKIMKSVRSFRFDENIFSIAEMLSDDLRTGTEKYYLLTDPDSRFTGIFSIRDMLIYLSSITNKDISLARKLQSGMVKEHESVKTESFEAAGLTRMAKGVGGDFYHIKKYAENRWFFCIGDVSGKGISASLVTAILGGMFSIYDFNRGLRDLIININNFLLRSFELEKFVTAIFLDFNELTGEMTVIDLGHSLFLATKKGRLIHVKAGQENYPLGIMPGMKPVFKKIRLEKDDLLVLLTDGLIEQTNEKGEQYSFRRFSRCVHGNSHLAVKELGKRLLDGIMTHKGRGLQNDDITLLAIRKK